MSYLLNESGVSVLQQYQMSWQGVRNVRRLSAVEDRRALVRAAFAADYNLDVTAGPPAGIAARNELSALICAWEASREQCLREVQLRAEQKSLAQPRQVSTQERTLMKRAAKVNLGKIPSSESPSSDYLASKMEEVENNEPHASRLDEITSQDDCETLSMTAALDLTGKVQIMRKRTKIDMPGGPEELRMRLRVEMHTWIMIATKHVNRPSLEALRKRHGIAMPITSWASDVGECLSPRRAAAARRALSCSLLRKVTLTGIQMKTL